MTAGTLTLTAAAAALLATLVWWLVRNRLPDWAALFLFGLVLVLVVLAGPLVRLP